MTASFRPPLPAALLVLLLALLMPSCHARPGAEIGRRGDEIMVCGRLFHTGGAPVVLWIDPGGYDAYRTEKRFGPLEQAAWSMAATNAAGTSAPPAGLNNPPTPNRYGLRRAGLGPDDLERVRGGGWDLPTLQGVIDQFVIHYDACGTSRQCFRILHDSRGLSVHFLLDVDGTIYQTLDLKERAWHATTSNDRSIGIEIANIGAYQPPRPAAKAGDERTPTSSSDPGAGGDPALTSGQAPLPPPLPAWYAFDSRGPYLTLPGWMGDGGIRTPNFVARPARPRPVVGEVQGQTLVMFDLTPQQYDSLIRLVATLCTVFPNLPCDYPRDADGRLITGQLPDDALAGYRGLLGHYHVQSNKVDPGPAFDWDKVVAGARRLMVRTASGETP
jgi:hypothetical protein